VSEIPEGDNWEYEPKWDGFRCLAFRDGKKVELQSKSGQPLSATFRKLLKPAKTKGAEFVLDGELVIPVKGGLSFDDLLQRIHPAASRVASCLRKRRRISSSLIYWLTRPASQSTNFHSASVAQNSRAS